MSRQKRTARTRAMQRRRKLVRRIARVTNGAIRTVAEFGAAIAEAFTPVVEAMVEVLGNVAEGLQAWFDSLTPEEREEFQRLLDAEDAA